MLDYLLVRPEDARLWRLNKDPRTLKYLVVDELHTFDGAQGSDLACLVRRVKARVRTPAGHLCAVGTSATLGDVPSFAHGASGEPPTSGPAYLRSYAETIFGETFDEQSVIGETVQTATDFLAGCPVTQSAVPGQEVREALDPLAYATAPEYVEAQHRLWFGPAALGPSTDDWRVGLAQRLKEHGFFRILLATIGSRAVPLDDLLSSVGKQMPAFGSAGNDYLRLLLDSFVALIATARVRMETGSGRSCRCGCSSGCVSFGAWWDHSAPRLPSPLRTISSRTSCSAPFRSSTVASAESWGGAERSGMPTAASTRTCRRSTGPSSTCHHRSASCFPVWSSRRPKGSGRCPPGCAVAVSASHGASRPARANDAAQRHPV